LKLILFKKKIRKEFNLANLSNRGEGTAIELLLCGFREITSVRRATFY